jgi:predicted transcriptional regulator
MPSLTIKLPATLNRRLRTAAHQRKEKLSVLTRRALERELSAPEPDFATLAKPYLGMFSGPRDLSSREGYGR